MTSRCTGVFLTFLAGCIFGSAAWAAPNDGKNLIANGSFEEVVPRNQFGHMFAQWGGWKYDGDCDFRVGTIGRTGKTSNLLIGSNMPKIRVVQNLKAVAPGRYKVTAFLRGLDIGEGQWQATTEFAFDGKYMQLKKNGTFGWTPLTFVVDVAQKDELMGPSFGLMAPGYLWIDDVSVVQVGNDVPLTEQPVLGAEEKPIAPPGEIGKGFVRCGECGNRNMPEWKTCFACGETLQAAKVANGLAVKTLASFEDKSPFEGGQIVSEHATEGAKALRVDKNYAVWHQPQDWSGYDYLKIDVYTDSDKPVPFYVEMRDQQTRDYWTRVNYNTTIPPGKSTLVLPLDQLYVGEKSRPGRNLVLSAVTDLVLSINEAPPAPVFFDNVRLERDLETPKALFDGLYAFDFGPADGPLMPGFTRITPSTSFSKGRGYGLKDATIWRAFNALQPDPLYQDFLCIEKGGLAVDVPNGKYHVFVNIDSPSGFWGETQVYRNRAILAQGKPVIEEKMTFKEFQKKYFRFWDVEDSPEDNTFDKVQRRYFQEKEFDCEVIDGQLRVDFQGENWACSVSALVVYPASKAAEGRKFLDFVAAKRRFFFDNYFHRVLHKPTGDPLQAKPAEQDRGYTVFTRDAMKDVFYNDTPLKDEIDATVTGFGFAGEYEPLSVAVYPLKDLGTVSVSVSDLTGPGKIPAEAVAIGYVSNRLSRVTAEGSVYTIEPRFIMPRSKVDVRKGVTRRFWLTMHPAADAKPGVYRGQIKISPEHGKATTVPVEYRVYQGSLDVVDIPVGPWGHEISLPWPSEDAAAAEWNAAMTRRCLTKLRDYGFTTFSGLPYVAYQGFKDGKPQFDFTTGDRQMKLARECGFTMPVVSYCGFGGLNLYFKDEDAMLAAGFQDYSTFIQAVFSAVQKHAETANWLPVYWNIGDEPLGETLARAADNAEAYHAAFPKGPPVFTAATSFESGKADDPHFRFAKALHAANCNGHTEESVKMMHDAGAEWAFYNGGNRWTFGTYMYKAAKQFGMKFRVNWHWNASAGDPYYALDCREDDYSWCGATPEGELMSTVYFEREMRDGVDDYRYLLTLGRLAEKKNDAAAKALVESRLAAFKLGQRDHDAIFPASDWQESRRKIAEAIERLRK